MKSLELWQISLIALLTTINTALAAELPVIPGAAGFGITTPAGRGGTVYKVTNLDPSGPGSLKNCVDQPEPRVCVFEVSGTIKLTSDLKINNPYITIAGQTAPSPGIMIRGAAIHVRTNDVLIQHLRVRAGDDPEGPDYGNRDSLIIGNMSGNPTNIVIDHSSFSWAIDENVSVWYTTGDITIWRSIISEGLHNSWHPQNAPSPHSMGPILGPFDASVSIVGSLIAHNRARNPLSRVANLAFVNNVVYNWLYRATDLQGENGLVTKNDIVGNVYMKGPDYSTGSPIYMEGGASATAMTPGSKVYVEDNHSPDWTYNDAWDLVTNNAGPSFKATVRQAWPNGLIAKPTANGEVLNWVLANAGARPVDRDSVDVKVIAHVRNKIGGSGDFGQLIDSVSSDSGRPGFSDPEKNAGGWPELAQNTRALTLPADPNGDDDGDGYTNLEEWLHAFAAQVEGGGDPSPLATPFTPTLTVL